MLLLASGRMETQYGGGVGHDRGLCTHYSDRSVAGKVIDVGRIHTCIYIPFNFSFYMRAFLCFVM
jgi:hypothetical protein